MPLRSRANHFSDEHWAVLNACAKKVARHFNNRVEVGDLITEGWFGYARRIKNLKNCHNFVYKEMYRWAKAWLRHSQESLESHKGEVDGNCAVYLKTSEEGEYEKAEIQRRMRLMSEKNKKVVSIYCQTGNLLRTGIVVGVSKERVRQVLQEFTRKCG